MREIYRLDKFEENEDVYSGHYAIWTTKMEPKENVTDIQLVGNNVYCFAGGIGEFDTHKGWIKYPEFMNKIADSKILLQLLEPYPEIDEF